MLSKMLPWDFVKEWPSTINLKQMGIYAYFNEDPYLEKMLMDRLPRQEIAFSIYSGNEVTREFVEEHFINLSFFSTTDHLMIMNAENIPNGVIDFLLEQGDCSDRFVLLFFNKSSKQFTESVKNPKLIGFSLDTPRFWEGPILWQFCMKLKNVKYDSAVTQFALGHLEHNFESFLSLIDTLVLYFPNGPVDMKLLNELIKNERWSFFDLINYFHENPKIFIQEILKKEKDFDWLIFLFNQTQTHLVKILYPQEIEEKKKRSKYDQTIIDMSLKLDRRMVKYYVKLFSEFEVLAKSKNDFLIDRLRLELLK